MEVQSKKRDYEYNPETFVQKPFELWAKVDSLGRKLIWTDSDCKIDVDNYDNPKILRVFAKATKGEKKVGELVCTPKERFGKKYIYLNFVKVDDDHKGSGYSFKMLNCLLAMLPSDTEGIISNFTSRNNPKPILNLFKTLGGFKNDFGYIELKNPKRYSYEE